MRLRKKQTSLIAITLVAVIILAWQLVDLMGSDISSNDSAVASSKTETRAQSTLTQPLMHSSHPLLQTEPTQANSSPLTLQKQNRALTANKRAYVEMVNRYEVAKMKHKLLQEELAIANARHQISVLNQQTEATPAEEHFGPTGFGTENNDNKPQMKLVYLDHQNAHWSATLFDGNQYQQIEVGAALKNDQKVIAINRQGVTIESGKKRFNLNFNGVTPLPNKPIVKRSNYTRPHYTHLSPKQKKASAITNKIEQNIINNKANDSNNNQPTLKPIKITLIKTPVSIKAQPPIQTPTKTTPKVTLKATPKPTPKVTLKATTKPTPKVTRKAAAKPTPKITLNSTPKAAIAPKVDNKKIIELNQKKMRLIKEAQKKAAHAPSKKPIAHQAKPKTHKPSGTSPLRVKQNLSHKTLKTTHQKTSTEQMHNKGQAIAAKSSPIVAKKSSAKIHHTASLDETVLLQMPASSYTIQLKDSHSKSDLIQFAKKHHIDDRTLCYTNKNHRQPYYTLVYGDYLTHRAAKSALHSLPNHLREKTVAVRRLAQVQQEINR